MNSTFDTSLIDIDIDSRSEECKKGTFSVAILTKFKIYEDGICYTVKRTSLT